MSDHPRITFYDDEVHVDVERDLIVGDVLPAYRGNGPRDGEQMGWVTVRAVTPAPGSAPDLELEFTPDREGQR